MKLTKEQENQIAEFRESEKKWPHSKTNPFTELEIIQIYENQKILNSARLKHLDTIGMDAYTYLNFLHQNGYTEKFFLSDDEAFDIYQLLKDGQIIETAYMINVHNMSNNKVN